MRRGGIHRRNKKGKKGRTMGVRSRQKRVREEEGSGPFQADDFSRKRQDGN